MNKKYYHASPHKFHNGDVLNPYYHKKHFNNCGSSIFMTNSPIPHGTIKDIAYANNWKVYEVLPLGKVKLGLWDDYYTESPVEIIKCVGNARGLSKKTHFKKKEQDEIRMYKEKIAEIELKIIQYTQEDNQTELENQQEMKNIWERELKNLEIKGSYVYTKTYLQYKKGYFQGIK